ncbi:MAG TPA: hypothetical protein VMU02_05165 [bacterium]|nr:hypothetical protein [bacterium]
MRHLIRVSAIGLLCLAIVAPPASAAPRDGKSLGKALLLSLALPGAGEAYLGASGRARVFIAGEAAIWSSFAYYRVQGRMREDAYKDEARLFAGVEGDPGSGYYRILAYYLSSEEYNVDVMREARLLYPSDRELQAAYVESHGYFGKDAWEWESLQRMEEFSRERTMSRQSYRRAVLTTGFAVLNRMVSMIDVYLTVKLGDQEGKGPHVSLGAEPTSPQGFRVYISAPF